MKKNLPVTDNERVVSEEMRIISSTDTKGIITNVNDDFLQIVGFSTEELVGANHNIVRHPDVPPVAFQDLWENLKAGRSWKGIVKNRCKSGDHYWVDAHVASLVENGDVIGFESVRVKPSRERVERAQAIYDAVNSGKSLPTPFDDRSFLWRSVIATLLPLLLVAVALGLVGTESGVVVSALLALGGVAALALGRWCAAPVLRAAAEAREVIHNPLSQGMYFGTTRCELGQLRYAIEYLQSTLRPLLVRTNQAASQVADAANRSKSGMHSATEDLDLQLSSVEQVASAIDEMVATVQEVASSTAGASQAAHEAMTLASSDREIVEKSIAATEALAGEVEAAAEVVKRVEEESQNIGSVLDVINGIAEQTNLLALNASIEAARAGEQGRGFAVVADEVRALAHRTKESTDEIQSTIQRLQRGTEEAVSVMGRGRERVASSLDQVSQGGQALESIGDAVSTITEMNDQIASSSEEQGSVAEEIRRNIHAINDLSRRTTESARGTVSIGDELAHLAEKLSALMHQFKV